MYTEQLHHKIEAYLSGDLKPGERAEFEQLLRNDPAVKSYLDAHRIADAAIARSIEQDLRNKLSSLDQDLDHKRKQENPGRKRGKSFPFPAFIAIAASLFIILALAMHFLTGSVVSPEKLAARNLVVLEGQTRGAQNKESPFQLMENAATAFQGKKYDEAADLYRAVMDGDNLLFEPAEFNLALALMAKGNTRDAAIHLEKIARDTDHQYQHEAAEILEKLSIRQ